MAEGDVYTGMMFMLWWSNNRLCSDVVVSEYMRVWVYIHCTVWYSMVYNSVCRYGIYSVYSMYRTVQYIVCVLCSIVYISTSDMWWCMTEWSKAHLTHWQDNRAMTEPWASVYMILCQCARSESNSVWFCCYLMMSCFCILSLP